MADQQAIVVSAVQPATGLRVITTDGPAEKAAPLATQTAPVGVIVPPPDIRSIVDKTAQFVARNGSEFEKRILANEKGNVKFNFLVPSDPYHAYYQQKVAAFRAEESGAKVPAQQPAAPKAAAPPPEAPAKVAVQLPTHFKPVVLEEPEKEQYTLVFPEGITALDLDVIKLTAQFVARNGKSFLTGLTSREHTNPQFNFLKPTHSMFPFFTSLADMYSKVLMPPKSLGERLRLDATDKPRVLDRCLKRLEWERSQARARKEAEDREEAEREAMAAIDWHDFVVVETIDFYNDEDDGLPAPQSLTDVIAQLRATTVETTSVQADDGAMDVEMDEEERAIVAEGALGPAPAGPPEPQMKIVRNYKPPGAARGAANAGQMVVSPITGELVPIDQIAEHMRISLIDPKWRKEREAMLGKLRGSTAASDEEIARNVVSLARTRPDIFGSTDEEVSVALSAEMERRKADERAASSATAAAAAAAPLPPPPALPALPPAMLPSALRPPMPSMPPLMPWGAPGMPPVPGFMPPMGVPPMPGYGYPPAYPPSVAPQFPPMPPGMLPMAGSAPIPPLPAGMAPPPGPPPPTAGDEHEPKRQRVDDAPLMPEEEFAEANQGPLLVRVTLPEVEGDAQLRGQTVELEVGSVMETIGDVKARLAAVIGVASSKQKMSTGALGFLKDTSTLAAYNFGTGTQLVMGLKERGGRTKK